jgi:hypothetical protein
MIEGCFTHRLGPGGLPGEASPSRSIIAVVSPHAGYIYSGPAAAYGYLHLAEEAKPSCVVIIGPNHSGIGSPIAMMDRGCWETPLGEVEVDGEVAAEVFRASGIIDVDEAAHLREHSIEVQLPFLQYIYGPSLRFVPISMRYQDLESSREVGRAIAEAAEERDLVVVASTDLSHYEDQASANRKDRRVLEAITSLDEGALLEAVHGYGVSMCGYGPVAAALVASKALGAEGAELLSYHTSGDVTGDYSAVVGYASLKVIR